MKFQLWYKDEYGQGSILLTSEDLQKVIKEGKAKVHDTNVENSLTVDDKKRNWESYFVEISSEDFFEEQLKSENEKGAKVVHYENSNIDYIYAGKDGHGKDVVHNSDGKIQPAVFNEDDGYVVRFYLGKLDNKTWYAETPKGKIIDDFNDPILRDKGVYFIRRI